MGLKKKKYNESYNWVLDLGHLVEERRASALILLYSLSALDLSDVLEDVDDVPGPPGALLDFAGKPKRGHGQHVKPRLPHHRLCVVKPV
jgi:hypothetical protein